MIAHMRLWTEGVGWSLGRRGREWDIHGWLAFLVMEAWHGGVHGEQG